MSIKGNVVWYQGYILRLYVLKELLEATCHGKAEVILSENQSSCYVRISLKHAVSIDTCTMFEWVDQSNNAWSIIRCSVNHSCD